MKSSLICQKKYYPNKEKFDDNLDLKFTARKIAFKISYKLRSNGLNQNDLAGLLDVTPQNISKLLKGDDYKISTLIKIEKALNLNLIDRDIHKKYEFNEFTSVQKDQFVFLTIKTDSINRLISNFDHIASTVEIYQEVISKENEYEIEI